MEANQRYLEHVITYKLGAYWKVGTIRNKYPIPIWGIQMRGVYMASKGLDALKDYFTVMPASTALSVGGVPYWRMMTSNLISALTCWGSTTVYSISRRNLSPSALMITSHGHGLGLSPC